MKTITICIFSLGLLFASCNGKTGTNGSSNKSETSDMAMETTDAKTIHLTKADFLAKVANYETNPTEWKYLGDKPALIDFYADWCGPCKMIAPILEELAEEYKDDLYIYKIDTEAEQELAAVFGIRSIPSLLFVPMEGSPQMAQGALPKHTLIEAINEVLLQK